MTATRRNFNLPKGTTWLATFVYGKLVAAGTTNAIVIPNDPQGRYYLPTDITGYTAKLDVAAWPTLSPVVSLAIGTGLDITANQDLIKVAQDTTSWDYDQVEYSLELTSPSSEITEIARGTISLEQAI